MNNWRCSLFITLTIAIACSLGASTGLTAQVQSLVNGNRFQYSAGFICGLDPPGVVVRILPGQYATAINIHNSSGGPAALRLRVSMTFPALDPPGSQLEPGAVSAPIERTLQPNEALMVDCQEIPSEFDFRVPLLTPPYMKGLLAIESNRSLDVTAVYTAGSAGTGGDVVESIEVEQIRERKAARFGFLE